MYDSKDQKEFADMHVNDCYDPMAKARQLMGTIERTSAPLRLDVPQYMSDRYSFGVIALEYAERLYDQFGEINGEDLQALYKYIIDKVFDAKSSSLQA